MIRGVLGRVARDRVYGWAFDDNDPTIRLTVRVRLGTHELGRSEANLPRADLQGLWDGNDGVHGFAVPLAASVTERQLTQLTAEAVRPGSAKWRPLLRHRPSRADDNQPAQLRPRPPAPAPVEPFAEGKAQDFTDFWSEDADRGQSGNDSASPVFVIGAPRSGTSALFAALTRATRYRGFNEGHVLDVAARLISEVNAHLEEKRQIQPPGAVALCHLGRDPHTRLRAGVPQLLRLAVAGYTTPFWVDKTPSREMIQSVPILAETWPNARLVFMKRRVLEHLMSRLRKFPGGSFEWHCRDWAGIMSDWRQIRASIPGKFIELEQREMLDDPSGSAEGVGAFVGLDATEIEALGARLDSERAEMTDPSARVSHRRHRRDWVVGGGDRNLPDNLRPRDRGLRLYLRRALLYSCKLIISHNRS